jgi:hypothetical protein
MRYKQSFVRLKPVGRVCPQAGVAGTKNVTLAMETPQSVAL